jgi:toxin ParE1/3/4
LTAYTIAPRARRDLQDAWFYSRDRWGRRRADAYVRELTATIEHLAANPLLGQACDDVRPGYRRHPAGSHMLFYVIRDEAVVVMRALHQQMDVEDKL